MRLLSDSFTNWSPDAQPNNQESDSQSDEKKPNDRPHGQPDRKPDRKPHDEPYRKPVCVTHDKPVCESEHEPVCESDQSPNHTLPRGNVLRHLPAREPQVHRALLQRNLPFAHTQADGAGVLQRVGAHRRLVRRRRRVRHEPDAEQLPGRLRRVPAHIAVRCAARISSCVRI